MYSMKQLKYSVHQCCPRRGPLTQMGPLGYFVGLFYDNIVLIVMGPLIINMQEFTWVNLFIFDLVLQTMYIYSTKHLSAKIYLFLFLLIYTCKATFSGLKTNKINVACFLMNLLSH